MKKLVTVTFIILLITSIFSINLTAEQSDIEPYLNKEVINEIENTMKRFEGREITVINFEILYDVNYNPSYLLVEFDEKGYAIFTRENLILSEYSMEIDSPYKNMSGYKLYLGANNYFSVPSLISRLNNKYNTDIISANEDMLSKTNSDSKRSNLPNPDEISWGGISESRMQRYNWGQFELYQYVDENGTIWGICGTVAATMLLAYYDDYFNNSIVIDAARPQFSSKPGRLYEVMWYRIDLEHPTGTWPWDLVAGINQYFAEYNGLDGWHSYRAQYDTAPTMIKVKPKLIEGKPVILGLLQALGSIDYGDHWVLAYGYSTDILNDYYKVVDGWANPNDSMIGYNYKKVVNKSWTSSFVYLD